MWVKVGVAHGDIQKLYPQLAQLPQQPDRFCRIKRRTAVLRHAEAVGVWEAVIDIQPGGDNKISATDLFCAADGLSQKPSAVFQTAAVTPRAFIGR